MEQQSQYPQMNQPYHPISISVPIPIPIPIPVPQQQSQYPTVLHPPQTLTLPFSQPQFPHQFLHPSYAPVQAQSQSPYDQPRSSGKRPREAPTASSAAAGEAADFPSPKRKKGQDVLFRIVVPSKQIGKVIGKEGSRIQKIRDETRASIKIADAIARYEDRVIIISSKDNEEGVTDAEKALHKIANLILQDDGTSSVAQNVSASVGAALAASSVGSTDIVNAVGGIGPAHVAANAIRLLIAGSQAGGLIGMSGQNIEKLRDSSGASVTVLAQNQLPFCASAHESDRLVQVSGEVPAVLKAVEEIGSQLREMPPKQVISISPAFNYSTVRTAQPYVDPTAAECVSMVMMISETMIGGFIGRSGSNISRIRNESGATIKVYGGKGEQKHRQIQLAGTPQQVALAKQRIDEYVYSQMIQSGAQLPLYDAGVYGAGVL